MNFRVASQNLIVCIFLVLVIAGCSSTDTRKASADSKTTRSSSSSSSEVKYDRMYDPQIQRILTLAKRDKWAQAEEEAEALYAIASNNPRVERVHWWVKKEAEKRRDKALEDKIRAVNDADSVFSPTPLSLITEQKNRGLPPRRDVRDAVEQIEATPYIPDSYGKVIIKKGRLFDLDKPAGKMAEILDRQISVTVDEVTLESIIFDIGTREGINFVADKSIPAFQQKISVNFQEVRLAEFLRYISRNMDVQFQVGDDLIWIVDAKDPNKKLEETRFYHLKEGFLLPAAFGPDTQTVVEVKNKGVVTTTTRTEFVQFVKDGVSSTTSIEKAIMKFFSGSEYMIDYKHNIIIARGTHEELEVLEQIIEEFDRPMQQVLIEARFITVSTAAYMQLGAIWESSRASNEPRGRPPTDFTGFGPDNVGIGLEEMWTDILGRDNLTVTLSALEQGGESQTLSAPRVTLVNNLPARISDGKVQYYYEEYTVSQALTQDSAVSSVLPKGKPTQITSGVSLEVMASIGGDGESILLALRPEVNQDVQLVEYTQITDASGNTFSIRLPESRTQDLSTRVIVKSGQTVVMGGVLLREQTTFVESVPILGSIPIIGAAFRRRTEVDQPRYLLIFVTATIVAETGEFLLYDNASSEDEVMPTNP